MVRDSTLFKRHDRKLSKSAAKRRKRDPGFVPSVIHFGPMPDDWEAAEVSPDPHTGHWPGWLPVGDGPEDQYHREAFAKFQGPDGTYELLGPKVQGNPYDLPAHVLVRHGDFISSRLASFPIEPPRDFDGLRDFFESVVIEGIVWHHPDGKMVKIKRRDFGLEWPA